MKKIILLSSVLLISCSAKVFAQGQGGQPSMWKTNGNQVTTGSEFIGTTNASDFNIHTNNQLRLKIDMNGHLIHGNLGGGPPAGIFLNTNPIPGFMLAISGGDSKFFGNLNVERSLFVKDYLQARSILADTIHMGPGKLIHGDGEWNGNLVVRKDLKVMGTANFAGDATVGGKLNVDKSITFGGVSKISYFPATATDPAVYAFGDPIDFDGRTDDPTGYPHPTDPILPPCLFPKDPTKQQFTYNGRLISNAMFTSYGYDANFLSRMDMGYDGANGIIDVSGTSTTQNPTNHVPALLINWYCGKDVYMCTGSNGGTVATGKTFEVGIPARDLNTAVNIKAENQKGIVMHISGNDANGNPLNAIDVIDNTTGVSHFRVKRDGYVQAREIKVHIGVFSDYVFKDGYKLMPLQDVFAYTKLHKHLPNVKSEKELVENGMEVGDMQRVQMEKIEEGYLYLFGMNSELEKLKAENAELKKQLAEQQKAIEEIKTLLNKK